MHKPLLSVLFLLHLVTLVFVIKSNADSFSIQNVIMSVRVACNNFQTCLRFDDVSEGWSFLEKKTFTKKFKKYHFVSALVICILPARQSSTHLNLHFQNLFLIFSFVNRFKDLKHIYVLLNLAIV